MKKYPRLLVCLLVLLTTCSPMKKEGEETIDHIILGINNLDKGITQFKELTGIEPVFGGIHPKSFTHNALVALDGETYIEIMAPRPDAKNVPDSFIALETLTPIDWAVRTRKASQTKEKLKEADFITTENTTGSRAKPDGALLSWTTFSVKDHDDFPFFIQWGASTIHPSATSPGGCTLQSFHVFTPDYNSMSKLNEQLQLGLTVTRGTQKQLQLTIDTPKGKVLFSFTERPISKE